MHKRPEPFTMHVEIDFDATNESNEDGFIVTPNVIFDQLSYVF
jgi:hypothetical protein